MREMNALEGVLECEWSSNRDHSKSRDPRTIAGSIQKIPICDNYSLTELENITNLELNCLVEWFPINKLPINTKKACYIICTSPNKRKDNNTFGLKIDGNNRSQVASTKYLGIYIEQFLTWDEHIKIIANKLAKI